DVEKWVRYALIMLAYSLGHLALVGILAGLVTGGLRDTAGSTALAVVFVGAFLWFGFVIGFSPLDRDVQTVAAIGAATLLAWPVSALVERNLYGDLTGRLVIRD